MHIPDGYLSPQTYIPLYAVFAGAASLAIRKLKKTLTTKIIPFLGISAAFSFLIMMFNIPAPGGSSGHAVGAALIALLFGPWVAFVSVSVALIIQAFIFGDGGITAIGANCVNMALVMPFIAYGIFQAFRGKKKSLSRMSISAFLAGYIGLNITAAITAIEFGIQPLIATSPEGTPLYMPFPIKYALPVMATEHLLIFGIAEGLITALLFRYFYRWNRDLIYVLK